MSMIHLPHTDPMVHWQRKARRAALCRGPECPSPGPRARSAACFHREVYGPLEHGETLNFQHGDVLIFPCPAGYE